MQFAEKYGILPTERVITVSRCQQCDNNLTTNEIGISLRLMGRDGRILLCRDCLAERLKVEPAIIDKKIEQFKNQGCPLFV